MLTRCPRGGCWLRLSLDREDCDSHPTGAGKQDGATEEQMWFRKAGINREELCLFMNLSFSIVEADSRPEVLWGGLTLSGGMGRADWLRAQTPRQPGGGAGSPAAGMGRSGGQLETKPGKSRKSRHSQPQAGRRGEGQGPKPGPTGLQTKPNTATGISPGGAGGTG